MDDGVVPLAVYCRNAQQCLQNAVQSRKAKLRGEELEHLKAFASLVTSSIPTHPQFRGWKDIQETQPVDLHVRIPEVKQRIRELEDSVQPCPSTKRPLSKPAEVRSSTKTMASPRSSKPNPSSKFSSEVMLKTSKSVRIVEAAPKQRPQQRSDVTMTETYGIAKTTKPNSLIQRLKRGPVADSKASPTRAEIGKEVARPSSGQGVHNPTSVWTMEGSGEITAFRPTPRSRDVSRMRGGAGPSTTLSGLGSTALKALTSSVVKGRPADEDCSSSGKPKFADHHATPGGWVWKSLRSGSSDASVDTVAESNIAMVKTDSDEVEELVDWIPSRENGRVPKIESGYGEESWGPEIRHRQGEFREERWFRPARGLGLREWKGGFLRGDHESHDSLDASGSDGSRSVDNRPASAPVRTAPTRVVKGTFTASPSPGVQRVVREDCERFRRQMRLLKEKADDTRMKEEEVEIMTERLQKRFVEEMDLDGGDIWLNNNHIRVDDDESEELREVHRFGRFSSSFQTIEHAGFLERTSTESLNRTMSRLMNGDYPNSNPSSPPPATRPLSETKKSIAESVSISSSSTSSQSSLPLSHYIQKLRDSRLRKSAGNGSGRHEFEDMVQKHGSEDGLLSKAVAGVDSSERRDKLNVSASSPGSSSAMLLTTSSAGDSPKGNHRPPRSPPFGIRLKSQVYPFIGRPPQILNNRKTKSDSSPISMLQTSPDGQHLTTIPTTVSDSGAMVAASQLQAGGKPDQQAICYPPDESRARVLSQSIYESVHHDANDEKIAHLQRVLGELKGSMEGVKIRIEVESEGWRGGVDRLEKELETLKETDDEISAAKHSFKNELKMKLSEFMSDTEKLLRQEKEQVQVLVEERIEEQVKRQLMASCWSGMKEEMCRLWSEVNSLIKSREDIAGHVERLTFVSEKVQEHSSREQDMLKSENGFLRKQLQSLQSDGGQVSSETDSEDLRQVVEKLKNDGIDMKLEIQGLRNIEKVMKVELGDLRTRLGKVQDETEESEREREMTLVAGARERLLIMERVENLSRLYLGGLEELRQDVSQVKFGCSERVEDLESQWNDFKRSQGILCEEGSAILPRQVLLDELDQFRCEIADMVETEHGLLKEILEKESTTIWRKVMDAYANNKSEMLSMLKQEIQKQLHSAREKVLNMTDALEHDMDALTKELRHTQDGAEDLTQIIISAERQKEVAAQAAAEATSSATKTREILTDMLVSIESEVANVRLESMKLQEKLIIEKDVAVAAASETRMVSQEVLKEKEAALAAFQEVRQKSQELQEYLEKESPKLVTAMVVVQKERDTASQAAAEATSSAMKAGGVLAEVLGSFNLEMAKARHINMQLQEGLEHERGLVTNLSQEVQDRFSEELEVAIATWKHAMDEEVAKVKKISEGLDKENQWQKTTGFPLLDLECYISKTEDKLSSLMTAVEQLQDSTNNHDEEKKRLKQDWKANMTQLNQVVQTVEERVDELSSEQTELRKRLKRFEGVQAELTQSVGEVRSSTCTLEKTVTSFLPQYDDAVQVVNDLSTKVDRMKKRIEGFAYDDDLAQVISRVAESKVESLKEAGLSPVSFQNLGRDLRDLQDRVENNDHNHCQAIAEVETRVAVMESTLCDIQNGASSEKPEIIGALNESIDALQRKMDILEQNGALSADHTGLENRIDHVSSATFNNLQLLDSKVENVSIGVQSALEGAALADSKCGALGAELVKVFRMLTLAKIPSNAHGGIGGNNWLQTVPNISRGRRGRSHSPGSSRSATQRLESRSQSPPPRLNENPAWNSGRGPGSSPSRRSGAHMPPSRLKAAGTREKRRGHGEGNPSSELRKVETRERDRAKEAAAFPAGETEPGDHPSRGMSPSKNDNWLKSYPRESRPFRLGKAFPGQAITVVEPDKQQQANNPYLALERRPKNLQKTNIRLEAGRIHVNVSRRSAAASANQSDKRSDAIAVQS